MTDPVAVSSSRPAHRPRRALTAALAAAVVALLLAAAASASAAVGELNLAQYKRIHRFALPLPPGTPAPAHSLLAEETSGVTYDPDTGTLFVVGDGGTSVVQVDKEGNYINSMTLAPGDSPQGTTFYDTEGIAYVGDEEFVITEERESKLDRFKYVAGGELTRADAKTVTIGEDNPNIGVEGVTDDPLNPNHMIAIKESGPERIYSTEIDWNAETATNFEASEGELFPAADVGTLDFSDVYALANVPGISAAEQENLLIISQESGEVVNISRTGQVNSRLALLAEPSDTISVPDMTNEGVTMDQDGVLYVVDEDGGGSQAHPQLWVYEPQTTADTPPTAVTLGDQTDSLPESTTGARVKLATVTVADPDEFGENNLSVTGPDASHFEVDHNGLYLKAGTVLNASTQAEYEVSVQVDDPTTTADPDATSAPYKLTVTSDSGGSSAEQVAITEVAPWSSGNSPFEEDWFELTNVGTTKVDLAGWRVNDNHASFASAVPWEGVTSLAPGHSAVLVDGTEAQADAFVADWFPGGAPSGFQIGWMPDGPGLSTSGDQVNIYDSTGAKVSGVEFGASPSGTPFGTFDNTAALGVGATTDPTIATLSTAGTNEAFGADGDQEIGSPGTAPVKSPVAVTEVAPWGNEWSEYEADWFELTNESPVAVDLTGWRMTDEAHSIADGGALEGVTSLAPGESAVFVETPKAPIAEPEAEAKLTAFIQSWFGGTLPGGMQVGGYMGPGLGKGGDEVNVSDAEEAHITGVKFGTSTNGVTFDNAAGAGGFGAPAGISTLSQEGVDGAFDAHDQIGSPGSTSTAVVPEVKITEVDPTSSSGPVGGDWFELTNEGAQAVDLTGWRMTDETHALADGGALGGVPSLPAGASAIFVEKPSQEAAFASTWFPGGLPAGFLLGNYGSGPGLGSGGDQVNLFDAAEEKITGVSFGQSTEKVSFDNAAGHGDATSSPPPTISTLSAVGVHGAFKDAAGEIGSPGRVVTPPAPDLTATTPVFPVQAASTIGPGQWVTIVDGGDADATISGVRVEESNPESAGDFIVGADHCTGMTVAPGANCQVLVRFAPGREFATSSAQLLVAYNAPDSPLTVALSGTSGAAPQIPKGDQDNHGNRGDTGPQGPDGKKGRNGKDGTVEFTASGSSAQARRGGVAHLQFRIRNKTAVALRGAELSAASLALKGTDSVAVIPIKAHHAATATLALRVGRHASLGRHRVKVELKAGGHTVAQTVVVNVTR